MKHNPTSLLLCLFVSLQITLYSQTQNKNKLPEEGVFWKISGNGLKKPSYLLGTMHTAGAKAILDSIPSINVVFDKVEQFCPEHEMLLINYSSKKNNNSVSLNVSKDSVNKRNLTEFQRELLNIQKQYDDYYTKELLKDNNRPSIFKPWPAKDSTYENLLTQTQKEKMIELAKYQYNFVQYLRPFTIFKQIKSELNPKSTFNQKSLTDSLRFKLFIAHIDSIKSLDESLQYKAKDKNIKIIGLEPVDLLYKLEDSLNIISPKISYKREIDFLVNYIENHSVIDSIENAIYKTIEKQYFKQNLAYFCNGSLYKIENNPLFIGDTKYLNNHHVLKIDYRNKLWLKKIPGLIRQKATLIAVGAGHLCGKNGLINQLRIKGYKVERIKK